MSFRSHENAIIEVRRRQTPGLDDQQVRCAAVEPAYVDYEPGGFSRVHRHPVGAYVYVIDGSVIFGIDDREPVVLRRETRTTVTDGYGCVLAATRRPDRKAA